MSRLPRSVKIVVHDGRNLDYRVVGSKKTPQTRKWRVIFIGGEKKQATGIVDEQDGFPRWDCEVLIAPPKPVDNVRMLVVDGKEREVGQVIINLPDLWPPSPPPSLVTSQLHVRELQATKHNPTPCGQLSFWIWAIDYWPEGTVSIAGSSGGHSAKQALRGSLSHLGAALKSSQHGSIVPSQSGIGAEGSEGRSRLGAKFRDIKNRNRENRSGASFISASGIQSHQPQPDEGSVLMGASIISSHAGLAPTVGGWTSAASELTGGMAVESSLVNGGGSYNPLGSQEQNEQETYGSRGTPSSVFAGESGGRANANNVWNVSAGDLPPPSSDAQPTMREGKSRRRHMVSQLKNKLSRSSANLSEIGSKARPKRSSPDGSRCDQDYRGSAISSKSKSGGVRRKMSSVFSYFRLKRKSKDNPDGFQSCIDLRQLMPLNEPAIDETLPPRFQDSRHIARNSENAPEPNAQYSGNTVKEEWGLPSTQPQPTSMTPAPNPKSIGNAAAYGLHPEEGPGKAKDDMTKRELIELASILEQRLLTTRTELVRANMEQNQLSARVEELNSELTQTRLQLSTLRSRLLEDNLTQYLEVTIIEDSPVVPPPRNEHLTTFQSPNPSPPGPTPRSPENSFLSKAKALATRSFGGGILSNATSQPNLTSTVFNGQNSFSPPSPPRNGANRRSLKRKFDNRKLRAENDEEEDFIGRRKKSPSESKSGTNGAIQRYSIYPLARRKSGSGESENLHVFTATLLRIESSPAKVAVMEAKSESQLKEIAILQRMGCYGYSLENGGKIQPDNLPTKLFLFDSEMFFLYHGLGVLRIAIPRSLIKNPEEKSPIDHLWEMLTATSNLNSVQSLTPFPLRYAAYVYYRSRGWIVRPSLTLGGADFLLYAESPDLRHAAFAVVVVPGSTNRSICDFTAHLRKLIIAQVLPPENYQTKPEPWDQIKYYSIEETLVSRPDIV